MGIVGDDLVVLAVAVLQAAQKLAALKQQRATLRKEVAWIVDKDV
jgi:hypothetical protein